MMFLLAVLAFISVVRSHTSEEWKDRTIYQIITDRFDNGGSSSCSNLQSYCGGTFEGIEGQLDYIASMGFDAIWISPVVQNTDGGYHGYWAQDLYKINDKFGGEESLKSLVSAAHEKGIWVMVDTVANHMGYTINDIGTFNPFNQSSHYHDCSGCDTSCNIADFGNQPQVEHCRLAGLPDLAQENGFVSDQLRKQIAWLVKEFDFDGVRIDTIPEVSKDFWASFNQALPDHFTIGENFNGNINYVAPYQQSVDALLNYPLFFQIRNVFVQQQSMNLLQNYVQSSQSAWKDISILGTFLDNHDNNRFLNLKNDKNLYKSALTYVLMSTGIPIIYYGTEQAFNGGADPNNREPLWPSGFDRQSEFYLFLQTVITARKDQKVWGNDQVQRYSDDSFYAFSRGNVFVALTNGGEQAGTQSRTITYHPYKDGAKICNVFYPKSDCNTVTNGKFDISLLHGEPKIYVPSN